jgi:hypothetical protein
LIPLQKFPYVVGVESLRMKDLLPNHPAAIKERAMAQPGCMFAKVLPTNKK